MEKKKYLWTVLFAVVCSTLLILFWILSYVPLTEAKGYYKGLDCPDKGLNDSLSIKYLEEHYQSDFKYFSSAEYLKLTPFCSPIKVTKDLKHLAKLYGNNEKAEDFLYHVLCDSNRKINIEWVKGLKYQKMMDLLESAERYRYHRKLNPEYKYFFRGVHRFWLNKVSTHLEYELLQQRTLKFNPEFRILVSKCAQNNYHIAIKYTYPEKVSFYLAEGRYAYIWNRYWHNSRWFEKLAGLIWVIATFIGYYMVSIWIYKRIRRTFARR